MRQEVLCPDLYAAKGDGFTPISRVQKAQLTLENWVLKQKFVLCPSVLRQLKSSHDMNND